LAERTASRFMGKLLGLAARSQNYARRLWGTGIDASVFIASISALLSSAFSSLAQAVSRVLRIRGLVTETSLARFSPMPVSTTWPMPGRPPEEPQAQMDLGRYNVSFLVRVSGTRTAAMSVARRVHARAPRPSFAPLPVAFPAAVRRGAPSPVYEEPLAPPGRWTPDQAKPAGVLPARKPRVAAPRSALPLFAPAIAAAASLVMPVAEAAQFPPGGTTPSGEQALFPQRSRTRFPAGRPSTARPLPRLETGSPGQPSMPEVSARASALTTNPSSRPRPVETAPAMPPTVTEAGLGTGQGTPGLPPTRYIPLGAQPTPQTEAMQRRVEGAAPASCSVVALLAAAAGPQVYPVVARALAGQFSRALPSMEARLLETPVLGEQAPLAQALFAGVAPPESKRAAEMASSTYFATLSGMATVGSEARAAVQEALLSGAGGTQAGRYMQMSQVPGYAPLPSPLGPVLLARAATPGVAPSSVEAYPLGRPAPPIQPKLRTLTPEVPRTLNVTVSGETPEEDLRDLERKISKILSDQVRRYYGTARLEEG